MAKVTHTEIINKRIEDNAKEYKEYKRIKTEAEARIAEIEAEIKAYMDENNITECFIGDYKVTYKVATRVNVDKDKVREMVGNAYDKESEYDRLTIS